MSSWNDQNIVNNYSDAMDNPEKYWYEDLVNIPSIIELLPKKDATVLDFGCGPGNFTHRLATVYKVCGADNAENMVLKARSKYSGIPFFVWDGLNQLPESRGKFDAVVAKLTFEFVEDLPRVARNLYDVLRPNGVLVFSVQHPLLAISIHPGQNVQYWSTPQLDVQIGANGTTVTKIHRNLQQYTEPFLKARFILSRIVEPEIPIDIADNYHANPTDLKFPKRLNIQLRRT